MPAKGTLETTIQRYIGRSADDKPGTLRGSTKPPVGSTFFETDTWQIARYDGSLWRYEPDNPVLAELQEIRDLLRKILETQQPVRNPFS